MALTLSEKEIVQRQFDCYIKAILRNEARSFQRHIAWRSAHEVSLSEMSEIQMDRFYTLDEYPSYYTQFNIHGHSITVHDDHLAQALSCLTDEKRKILLLAYFLDMNDREIAVVTRLIRRTVQNKRMKALVEMRKRMEELRNGKPSED